MVVILSRHGVRSPTWAPARLDSYSAKPWPRWNVPPGDLTSRGYGLMKLFGSYDRASFAQSSLFRAQGCEDAASTYIWADVDQRTMASGHALAEGLFPGCALAVNSAEDKADDPVFHSGTKGVTPAQVEAAFAELDARVKQMHDAKQSELMEEMQHVLLGCAPKVSCTPAQMPATMLVGATTVAARGNGKGDHLVELQGPLPQASSFSEDLLLEYADGMPMAQVGWGNVDQAQLSRFLELHSDYFELIHRTPALARIEASNMLTHIVRTLQQEVEQKPVADAIGPVGSKLVMLVGHDTNLAGVASLLGVHWMLDGRVDDTPPGTELAFELWQSADGTYSVRVRAAMQTLQQMRDMQTLTLAAPPAHKMLNLPGCSAKADACGWEKFSQVVKTATQGTK
ncbi:histidine-type phosphatase [Granulicella sp. WH15]|uniref:histidine-type phosphatase n=1 Tax=Granulicella sp. WH15 TaxID=2602070 RepID=UPI0013A56915|nr:histidine-type phosphatase [Granulicella sp. WH15]